MVAHATQFRRARQKGQELIEFTLMVFVILGFFSMIIDISWMVFTRATLQYAIREGCRYAVANGSDNVSNPQTPTSERAAILTNVEGNSVGFLASSTPACTNPVTTTPCINVAWYAPNALNTPLSLTATPAPNQAPNVVEVDIVQFPQRPLLGIFIENSVHKFITNAASADVME
jgi:Flp pilus assembly protein TadG